MAEVCLCVCVHEGDSNSEVDARCDKAVKLVVPSGSLITKCCCMLFMLYWYFFFSLWKHRYRLKVSVEGIRFGFVVADVPLVLRRRQAIGRCKFRRAFVLLVCNAKDAARIRPFPTFHLLSLGCWAVVRFAIGAIN